MILTEYKGKDEKDGGALVRMIVENSTVHLNNQLSSNPL